MFNGKLYVNNNNNDDSKESKIKNEKTKYVRSSAQELDYVRRLSRSSFNGIKRIDYGNNNNTLKLNS